MSVIRKLTVYLVKHDGLTFEAYGGEPIEDSIVVRRLDDDTAAIGFAVYDDSFYSIRDVLCGERVVSHLIDRVDRQEYSRLAESEDPCVVPLACYEHGGRAWALAGSYEHSMFPDQRWDVHHKAGFWMPDDDSDGDYVRDKIESSAILALIPGHHIDLGYSGGNKKRPWILRIDGKASGTFSTRTAAAKAAASKLGVKCDPKELRRTIERKAAETARRAVDVLNRLESGEVYGISSALYLRGKDNVFRQDDTTFESVSGFIEELSTVRKTIEDDLDSLIARRLKSTQGSAARLDVATDGCYEQGM